jgi:hypothetical protein
MPALRVFLCHSSDDKVAVRNLYHRLSADGYSPWLDEEELLPGQEWEDELPKAVRRSDIVIVCLSAGSITKTGYVQKEIKFALDVADEQPQGTMFIIPLKLEPCDVPGRLLRWHWVNLFEERGYEKLKRALEHRATTGSLTAPKHLVGLTPEPQAETQVEKSAAGLKPWILRRVVNVNPTLGRKERDERRKLALTTDNSDSVDIVEESALGTSLTVTVFRSVSFIVSWLSGVATLALLAVLFGIPTEGIPNVRIWLASTLFLFSLFFIGGVVLKGTARGLVTAVIVGLFLYAIVRFGYSRESISPSSPPLTALTPSAVVADPSPSPTNAAPSVTPSVSPSPTPKQEARKRPTPEKKEPKGFVNKLKPFFRKPF